MKFDLKKPCKVCPFRKTALPSYLGDYTPAQVISGLHAEAPFFCHDFIENSIGYTTPGWRAWAEEHGQICAGSMVMMNRICKLPRMREWSQAVQKIKDCKDVFATANDFLTYHERSNLLDNIRPLVMRAKKRKR